MSIKIKINDSDCDIESSKFFGDMLLPEKWLIDDVFSPDEMFLCQINLEEVYEAVGKTLLPEEGMLYFFIDYKKKPLAAVRYSTEEADAYTCFNEDWEGDFDVYTDWEMEFSFDAKTKSRLLCKDANVSEGEIALLKYVPNESDMDFMADSGKALYFIINEIDLKNKDFSKVKLKFADEA